MSENAQLPSTVTARKAEHQRKVRRQVSAQQRQAAANLRTPEEQLARLDQAGLVATKERAKLAARIAARDSKKSKK